MPKTKRLAGVNEVPRYGQVWSWDNSPPMMAVVPMPGPSRGHSVRWLFVRLTGKRDSTTLMWVGENGGSIPWFVFDE